MVHIEHNAARILRAGGCILKPQPRVHFLPLPARNERGEGRGGGRQNLIMISPLPVPLPTPASWGEGIGGRCRMSLCRDVPGTVLARSFEWKMNTKNHNFNA
jgi:hypothetical protein